MWGLISPPPHSLPLADALWRQCVGGSRCARLGAQVCTGTLPVAARWGLAPMARPGPLQRVEGPRLSGLWIQGLSLFWPAAGGACGHVSPAPCGFCTMAAGWPPTPHAVRGSPQLFSRRVVGLPLQCSSFGSHHFWFHYILLSAWINLCTLHP